MTEPVRDPPQRSLRRVGIALGLVAVSMAAIGAFLFSRTQVVLTGDPGRSSRTPETLDKMLDRAEQAEKAGDRGAAIVAYRFVVAVGAKDHPELEPYIEAALRGLARLGVPPTAGP